MISMSMYFGEQTRWYKARASRSLYSREERCTVMPLSGVVLVSILWGSGGDSVMAETVSTLR